MDKNTVKPNTVNERHKKAVEHHELAAKFHHEASNHENACESTLKAHAQKYTCI